MSAAPVVAADVTLETGGQRLHIEGDSIAQATPLVQGDQYAIQVRVGPDAARALHKLTAEHVGFPMLISVCGFPIAQPFIREALPSGSFQIDVLNEQTALTVSQGLNANAPCPK